ncbi:hypothetical protein [Plantibacter sp. YIM 135347]|uniref:DUF7882 family protein n=1 Tax=Plantibacter sp. YIM 135347 TaxID=3423919 RepID=UPI003D34A81C
MGALIYGSGPALELEDRTLAHVQRVIVAKLRKREPFQLGWAIDPQHGAGRISLWIDAGVPISFRYRGSRPIEINRSWIERMLEQSYTLDGLDVHEESALHSA